MMSPGRVTDNFLNGSGGSRRSQHPPQPPPTGLQIPQPPCQKAGQVSVPHFINRKTLAPPSQQGCVLPSFCHCAQRTSSPAGGETSRRGKGEVGGTTVKALGEGAVWMAGGTGVSQTQGTLWGKAPLPRPMWNWEEVPRPREGRKPRMDNMSCPPSACSSGWAGSKSPRMRSRSMVSSFKGQDGRRGRACLWAQSQGRGGGEGRGCLYHPRGGREGPPAWPSPALEGQVG